MAKRMVEFQGGAIPPLRHPKITKYSKEEDMDKTMYKPKLRRSNRLKPVVCDEVPQSYMGLYTFILCLVKSMSAGAMINYQLISYAVLVRYLCNFGLSFVPENVISSYACAEEDVSNDPMIDQLQSSDIPLLIKLAYMMIPRGMRFRMAKFGNIVKVVYEAYFHWDGKWCKDWYASFPQNYNAEYQNMINAVSNSMLPLFEEDSVLLSLTQEDDDECDGPEETVSAPLGIHSQTDIRAQIKYCRHHLSADKTVETIFEVGGNIDEFLQFQWDSAKDKTGMPTLSDLFGLMGSIDGKNPPLTGDWWTTNLSINKPIGDNRYIVSVQQGTVTTPKGSAIPSNLFSIIPILVDKPSNKDQHVSYKTADTKWRSHKWPTISEIDLSKYIQEADQISTFTSPHQLDIDLEVTKGDDDSRICIKISEVAAGWPEDIVPQVDGAYVLLDTASPSQNLRKKNIRGMRV